MYGQPPRNQPVVSRLQQAPIRGCHVDCEILSTALCVSQERKLELAEVERAKELAKEAALVPAGEVLPDHGAAGCGLCRCMRVMRACYVQGPAVSPPHPSSVGMRLLPEEERVETLSILARNKVDVERALQVQGGLKFF